MSQKNRSHSSSEYEEPTGRQDSTRSSRLGSFIEGEPNFESQGSSESSDLEVLAAARPVVAVVWQNLVLVSTTLACVLAPRFGSVGQLLLPL